MDWLKKLTDALTTKIESKKVTTYDEVVIAPEGYEVFKLQPDPDKPRRIVAAPQFWNPKGWIDYVRNWQTPTTHLFAEQSILGTAGILTPMRITAVLDYHSDGRNEDQKRENPQAPEWCEHRAILQMAYSTELIAWMKAIGKWMTQEEFALFIEERADEISNPTPAAMSQIALNVEATLGGTIKANRDLSNTSSITLITDSQTRPTIEIPRQLEVFLPVFEGTDATTMRILVRYKFQSAQAVTFQLLAPQINSLIIRATERIIDMASAQTALPIYGAKL